MNMCSARVLLSIAATFSRGGPAKMFEHEYLTVTDVVNEANRRFGAGAVPRSVSDWFYARKLDIGRCPIVGGRRLIPRDYAEVILAMLRDRAQVPMPNQEETR